jgi:hypothetical protein
VVPHNVVEYYGRFPTKGCAGIPQAALVATLDTYDFIIFQGQIVRKVQNSSGFKYSLTNNSRMSSVYSANKASHWAKVFESLANNTSQIFRRPSLTCEKKIGFY